MGAGTTAETSWVAGKVNKIKAGNLRAPVLREPCRQQQGGSVKDRAGGEDYSMCVCMGVHVFVCVCQLDFRLLCKEIHCDRAIRGFCCECVFTSHGWA